MKLLQSWQVKNVHTKKGIELTYIDEWALEYCECDEDGEFVEGSDYDMADEEIDDEE